MQGKKTIKKDRKALLMIQRENKEASHIKLQDVQLALQSVLQIRSFKHSYR